MTKREVLFVRGHKHRLYPKVWEALVLRWLKWKDIVFRENLIMSHSCSGVQKHNIWSGNTEMVQGRKKIRVKKCCKVHFYCVTTTLLQSTLDRSALSNVTTHNMKIYKWVNVTPWCVIMHIFTYFCNIKCIKYNPQICIFSKSYVKTQYKDVVTVCCQTSRSTVKV